MGICRDSLGKADAVSTIVSEDVAEVERSVSSSNGVEADTTVEDELRTGLGARGAFLLINLSTYCKSAESLG